MLLDQILLHVPCPIFWKNLDGVFLGCNKLFLTVSGFNDYSELVGKVDAELPWKQYEELYYQDDQYVIKTGNMITRVEYIPFEDRTIVSETTKTPLTQDGQIIGVLGIALDITDRKQAEELRFQNTVNEEKMETMKMLAASIAHEIRTPLAAVKAQGSVIQTILPTLLEAYEFALEAGQIKKPLRRAQLELLEHLPEELSHITSSANVFIDMLLHKVNLEKVRDKNIQLRRLNAKEALMDALHHYPLDDYSAGLLCCDYKHSFEFMGDEVLFQHVIFNLLKNAIYYVRATGRPGEIKIWFEQGKDCNILHFKDTGKGINKENLANIFNSFYTRTRHGTGVGLAFCKMIVESFGGAISCDSVEDKYTHFMLSFPKLESAK